MSPSSENIAKRAGLTDIFPNGGTVSKQYIIETTGSGIAWIDYNNDGWLDLFVVSGEGGTNRMYRNEGGKRFRDVTESSVCALGWAQGVCAGDYDNDGYTDLFVTYWGKNRLYRNVEGKRFNEVTAARAFDAGSRALQHWLRICGCRRRWTFGSVRRKLFTLRSGNDAQARARTPIAYYRGIAVNCGPRGLPFDRNILYRNNGDGTFRDVSDASGMAKPDGHYALSVLTGDFNEDGLTDIYVACDQTPSLLYINKGGGRFEEEGVLRGVAFDQNGKALSGMGVDAADYAGDGHAGIFRTQFSDEFETLYRNRGKGNFDDVTLEAGLGANTRYVGWGAGFFDFDNDGWKDLLLVNGHAFPEVERLHIDIHYKDRAILYRNLANGKFRDISENAGPGAGGTPFGARRGVRRYGQRWNGRDRREQSE